MLKCLSEDRWSHPWEKEIIGMHILRAFDKNGSIVLAFEDDALELAPEGDCCASCYIQHVSNADALQNAVITSINLNENHEDISDSSDSFDVLEKWHVLINTTKGTCSIELRLGHNGYYGGELYPVAVKTLDGLKLLEDY